MRGIPALLLTVCLIALCACPALAEGESLPVGEIVELSDGQSVDLDGDGDADDVAFTYSNTDDTSAYHLSVGGSSVDGDGMYLTGRLHAVRMDDGSGETLLFVSDYGMSDDPTSYVFSYFEGALVYIATVDAMPWTMRVSGRNTLSCEVRASILQTWNRPCVYVVSKGMFEDGDRIYWRSTSVNEMPMSEYPMGTSVTVNRDITLQVSRTNGDTARVIKAGSKALIVATDDIEWLYIAAYNPGYDEYDAIGGWMKVYDFGFEAEIDGQRVQTGELFTGLLYAD